MIIVKVLLHNLKVLLISNVWMTKRSLEPSMNFPQQQSEEANHFDIQDHPQHTVASSLFDEKEDDEYCLDSHIDSP